MPSFPAPPYGGVLVRSLVDSGTRDAIQRDARDRPHWTLTASQAASVELLLSGAYSPLAGFMTPADARSCEATWRLDNGTPWPAPVTLDVSPAIGAALAAGDRLVLRDTDGRTLGLQHVDQIEHGGAGLVRVAGHLDGLQLPTRYDFANLRETPEQIRAAMVARGWGGALAVFARRWRLDIDPARVAELTAALDAGVIVFVADDTQGPAHLEQYRRIDALREWIESGPADRGRLCVLPWPGSVHAHRRTVLEGIVARNYGCSHFLGALRAGQPDERFAREAIAALGISVIDTPRQQNGPQGVTSARPGAAIFFTGLSGAGKSTIANALRVRLLERGREVSLLDGDLVRQHLSSELGFSREHRELNVRRIAFVAAEVARHGGIAICAPIAPYEALRTEVRAIVEASGAFVLVYVDTPLEVCEARDTKGLYARARAGLVPAFTGVSDPYEIPTTPDLTVHAAAGSPTDAVDQILALLTRRQLL
jgi:sulfate adenylyltransferase